MFTNLPRDVITNTFHFNQLTTLTLEESGDLLLPVLKTFYQSVYNSSFCANYALINNAHINFYNLAQPIPRVPYTLQVGATGLSVTASSVPTETSAVISFQGLPLAGTPQSRRRGRIYIGALGAATITGSTVSTYPVLAAGFLSNMVGAADALPAAALAASHDWVVWSSVDQLPVKINNGWVDNSPDTQRRRSVDSSQRNVWTA